MMKMVRNGYAGLKPCPFCGGRAAVHEQEVPLLDSSCYFVMCHTCYTNGRLEHTVERAKDFWNTRYEAKEE